jgi:hypothetical protein
VTIFFSAVFTHYTFLHICIMSSAYAAIFGTPHAPHSPPRFYAPIVLVYVVVHGDKVTVFDQSDGAVMFANANPGSVIHHARVHETVKPAVLFRSSDSNDSSPGRCDCAVTGLGLMSRTSVCPNIHCPKK